MKDIYKQPIFYYVLVPVLMLLWPLTLITVSLPNAEKELKNQKKEYQGAEKIMGAILQIDPERLDFSQNKQTEKEFDYAVALENIASSCGISTDSYDLSSGRIVSSSQGQKNQSARVNLEEIDIVTFAKFFSKLQFRWANLQCSKIKLTKKQGAPDIWDIDLELKYYF